MVLEDYNRKGNYFKNPLESKLKDKIVRINPLDEIYPEVFWIYLLYKKRGLRKTIEILKELTKEEFFSGLISELILLNEKDLEKIKNNLSKDNFNCIKEDLKEIIIFFRECPLKFIYEKEELEEIYKKEQTISDLLMNCFLELDYKYSFGYIMTLGIYTKNLVDIGKIKSNENVELNLNLEDLERNQESKEHLSKYGGQLRALSLMIIPNTNFDKTWKNYFWKDGLEKTGCYDLTKIYGGTIYFYGEDIPEDLTPQVREYLKKWSSEVYQKIKEIIDGDLFKDYKYSYEDLEKNQIVTGLLNREIFLFKKIVGNLVYWEKEIITILHRVILENHINLIWFNEKSKKEDCKKFIFQGLSDKKLYIEKIKELNKNLNSKYQEQLIRKFEEDLWKETNPMLQDIKIGEVVNIRKKSEELNLTELHWIYDALSDTSHANWTFLSDKYLKLCTNPLHKRHLIPKNYYEYTNLESIIIIFSMLIEILGYSKQRLNINLENKDLDHLKVKAKEFEEMFLGKWKE